VTGLRHGTQANPIIMTIRELSPAQKVLLSALVLFALSIVQYSYTLGNPLIWDSESVVAEDPSIQSLANIPSFFVESSLPEVAEGQLKYYRPVVKILYAFEYALFGTDARGYHAINVLVNALVVVALFFLIDAISEDRRLALCASFLYAVNPARGEAVCWVYAASNLLMALFIILSLIGYHRRRHALAIPAFAMSLLSRESAVLFPVLLLLYEHLIRSEQPFKRYTHVAPYAGLAALYLLVRAIVLEGGPSLTDLEPLALMNTITVITQRMLRILLVPDAPVAVYPLEVFETLSAEVLLSYVVVTICLGGLVLIWRRDRRLAFAGLWGFVWISIWFNVGQFGHYLMNEKALYLASAGFLVLGAALLLRMRFGTAVLAAVVAAHFTSTFVRSTYWRDSTLFFEEVVASAPNLAPARLALGMEYATQGDWAKAVPHLEQAVKLEPGRSVSLNNLGTCHHALGDLSKATALWKRALAADPGNGEAAYNLGLMAERAGNLPSALDYYRRYLAHTDSPPLEILQRIRQLETRVTGDSRAWSGSLP
jgi:tetratricopeptide (TPR) repeat protein